MDFVFFFPEIGISFFYCIFYNLFYLSLQPLFFFLILLFLKNIDCVEYKTIQLINIIFIIIF
ncbi:hypothetical protein OIU79_023865 [Salix purpurea]|uniref:Uncharacterized protein n=1 Tax=Salix purpurea TaxID=77065 RepID=A0A9Q0W9K9_SALPP|nr:hypothetical protein OIU79_023865 [Salix purpurea]